MVAGARLLHRKAIVLAGRARDHDRELIVDLRRRGDGEAGVQPDRQRSQRRERSEQRSHACAEEVGPRCRDGGGEGSSDLHLQRFARSELLHILELQEGSRRIEIVDHRRERALRRAMHPIVRERHFDSRANGGGSGDRCGLQLAAQLVLDPGRLPVERDVRSLHRCEDAVVITILGPIEHPHGELRARRHRNADPCDRRRDTRLQQRVSYLRKRTVQQRVPKDVKVDADLWHEASRILPPWTLEQSPP